MANILSLLKPGGFFVTAALRNCQWYRVGRNYFPSAGVNEHDFERLCDLNLMQDEAAIKRFVRELCDLIKMRRFGETQVVRFGDDPRVTGFSMT